jgi:hypothetical protein
MTIALLLLTLHVATDPLENQLAAELARFPPVAVVKDNYHFAQEHRSWCEQQAESHACDHHGYALYRQMMWTEWSRDCWSKLDDAQVELCNYWYHDGQVEIDTRRSAAERFNDLEKLKALLGEEAYAAGQMPPPAPFWRFAWIE